jgi:hypothetical protein
MLADLVRLVRALSNGHKKPPLRLRAAAVEI